MSADNDDLRPDQQPGFWPEYRPPASRVAEAIQRPLNGPHWQGRMINAYLQDSKAARRAPPQPAGDET